MPLLAIALSTSAVLAPQIGWSAPPSCPAAAEAQATLDRLLAESQTADDGPAIRVRIEASGDRFVATVAIGPTSDRVLEGDACAQVADAALLIVAMAIDPRLDASSTLEVPEPEAPPETEPESAPEPDPEPVPSPTRDAPPTATTPARDPDPIERDPPRRIPRPRALVRASAGMGIGGPPIVTAVVAIGVAAQWRRARIELDGDLWTPRERRSAPDDPTGVDVVGWTVGVRGCGSPIAARIELPICGGVRTGALRGRGTGPITSIAASSIWVTASAGVGLWGWIRPRFALALDLDATVALTMPRFQLEPGGVVFRALPAGMRAIFGPVVRLP